MRRPRAMVSLPWLGSVRAAGPSDLVIGLARKRLMRLRCANHVLTAALFPVSSRAQRRFQIIFLEPNHA